MISSLGLVTNSGLGKEPFACAVRSGRARLSPVQRGAYHVRNGGSRSVASVDDADLQQVLPPARARRMSRPSRFAVVAALEAAAEREEDGAMDWEPASLWMGTCYGPSAYTEGLLRQVADEGPQAASPTFFIESVANAPAAQVALRLRCRGANVTITQREASTVLALGQAARAIATGRTSRALAGSVEELNPLLHSVLDRYGALSHAAPGEPERARPFDRSRDGFVLGEGAAIVCVEREDEVASPLARVLGVVRAFDPSAPSTSWGRGASALAGALRRGLERMQCDPGSIDLIVSGANGARDGDALEAAVLTELWPDRQPAILAPKAVSGEFGGAPLAAAVLACSGVDLGPGVAANASLDPALGLRPSPAECSAAPPGRVLVSALAVGGAAAWLILESCAR